MYDIAFILQVNHIFMKKISLNKESTNFAIVSFQMLNALHVLHHTHFLWLELLLWILNMVIDSAIVNIPLMSILRQVEQGFLEK